MARRRLPPRETVRLRGQRRASELRPITQPWHPFVRGQRAGRCLIILRTPRILFTRLNQPGRVFCESRETSFFDADVHVEPFILMLKDSS